MYIIVMGRNIYTFQNLYVMAEAFVMSKPNLTFENVFLYTLVRLDVPKNRITRYSKSSENFVSELNLF